MGAPNVTITIYFSVARCFHKILMVVDIYLDIAMVGASNFET